jgi:GR25 family glycosyltransferase involved in LPS biosynthesis
MAFYIILFLLTLLVYFVLLVAFTYDYKELLETIKEHYSYFGSRKTIPYPIFYINLDRSPHRNEFMVAQLKQLGVPATRCAAIDGNDINVRFVNSYSLLTKYEIGCTLSHLRAIKQAYESGTEIAMICEDDVWFSTISLVPDLTQVVRNAPSDWEILQIQNQNMKTVSIDDLKYTRNAAPKIMFGAACYLINRRGMKTIIDLTLKNETWHISGLPKAGVADVFIFHSATTYFTLPSLFVQNNTDISSDIGGIRSLWHLRSMRNTLTTLLSDAEKRRLKYARLLSDLIPSGPENYIINFQSERFLKLHVLQNLKTVTVFFENSKMFDKSEEKFHHKRTSIVVHLYTSVTVTSAVQLKFLNCTWTVRADDNIIKTLSDK